MLRHSHFLQIFGVHDSFGHRMGYTRSFHLILGLLEPVCGVPRCCNHPCTPLLTVQSLNRQHIQMLPT